MTRQVHYAIIIPADGKSNICLGVAQLVARYLGVVEAVGSSPVTQTRLSLDAIRVRTLSFYGMFLHSGECLSVKSPKMILKLA